MDVEANNNFCLIQVLEQQMHETNETVLTDYDCPVLVLSKTLRIVSSQSILSPVSIIHLCNHTCTFRNARTTRQIERQDMTIEKMIFQHNIDNIMYCLNIFCTSI